MGPTFEKVFIVSKECLFWGNPSVLFCSFSVSKARQPLVRVFYGSRTGLIAKIKSGLVLIDQGFDCLLVDYCR